MDKLINLTICLMNNKIEEVVSFDNTIESLKNIKKGILVKIKFGQKQYLFSSNDILYISLCKERISKHNQILKIYFKPFAQTLSIYINGNFENEIPLEIMDGKDEFIQVKYYDDLYIINTNEISLVELEWLQSKDDVSKDDIFDNIQIDKLNKSEGSK